MDISNKTSIDRRTILRGSGATALLLAMPACTGVPGFGLTEAIQRLLQVSSQRAFARMTAPDGYWDNQIAQIGVRNFLGGGGGSLGSLLTSDLFKGRLERAFAGVAEKGAARAAPFVADAVRNVSIADAAALVRGGPTAATRYLQGQIGGGLIGTLVPEVGSALRIASDPVVNQAVTALVGKDVSAMAGRVSSSIDTAIWREIGVEESAIRANPRSTNDAVLIGVFGVGSRL